MYLITAGHCIFLSGVGDEWTAFQPRTGQQHVIGRAWNHKWDSTGDMAIIRINNPAVTTGWNPKPWVYVRSSAWTVEDPDYYISDDGGQGMGERLCKTGRNTNTLCGTVTGLNLTRAYTVGGVTVTVEHLGGADIFMAQGDSGGPLFDGHVAYGIAVAGRPWPTAAMLYQGVSAIEHDMNVNIVHGTS